MKQGPETREFHSFNPRTGLLEGIEDVRVVGLDLIYIINMLLEQPMAEMLLPPAQLNLIMTTIVTAKAMLQPTTQAGYARDMGKALGMTPEAVEREIAKRKLSEEYAYSSPNVAIPHTPLPEAIEKFLEGFNEQGNDQNP